MNRVTLLLLAACGPVGEVSHTDPAPADRMDVTRKTEFLSSDANGRVRLGFDVDPTSGAFAIEGRTGDLYIDITLEELYAPDGALLLERATHDEAYTLTDAIYPESGVQLDWPIRSDHRMEPGRWEATFYVDDFNYNPVANQEIEFDILQRPSRDGVIQLRAQMLIADNLPKSFQDPAAYADSVAHWKSLWAAHGIEIDLRWGTVTLPAGKSDDEDWRKAVDAAGTNEELTIVLTKLKGKDWKDVLGYVSALQGPMIPSEMGIITMDVVEHAGRDGVFDDTEANVFGETLAHEVLHYLGLAHPVETDLETWDSMDDTPECTGWEACDAEIGENIMYPVTVCDNSGCVAQVDLTPDQIFMARHWIGSWVPQQ